MTIRQYLQQKLSAFGKVSEADFAEVSALLDIDSEYSEDNAVKAGTALCRMIEERVLSPYVSNVSENGFSMSWNYDNLGKYYLWLCKKYGITPEDEVLSILGISVIADITDMW